eukprot:TRINITY_DN949_c1_g2_i1.p1 TRINITY_DN949_c1_g2~~TRINITY_DN949_c1_g2_i1.p1  ORF type:complete len:331 (+),score=103.33 TRINITY_DN949_c1_g2_i1:89-994(+)
MAFARALAAKLRALLREHAALQQLSPPKHAAVLATRTRAASAAAASNACGFDARRTHAHIALSDDGAHAQRRVDGLYRLTAMRAPLRARVASYVEMEVRHMPRGGLLLGVALVARERGGEHADGAALRRMLGARHGGVGFHSDGWMVADARWRRCDARFAQGDTVSLCVRVGHGCGADGSAVSDGGSDEDEELRQPQPQPQPQQRRARGCGCEMSVGVNGVWRVRAAGGGRCFGGWRFVACLYRAQQSVAVRCCAHSWRFFAQSGAEGEAVCARTPAGTEAGGGKKSTAVSARAPRCTLTP